MKNRPTVVSLFAGCGGSSLGYIAAGYRELAAVEFDDEAADAFEANIKGVPVLREDVSKLAATDLMRRAGVGPGELSVLDASCPCQGFSMSGGRDLNDPRNGLYLHFVRLLAALRPRAFVFENVPGLVKGRMRGTYLDVLKAARGAGYKCAGQVLDASRYGVPQRRLRVVIVGVRDDLGVEPPHPVPFTRPPTVRDAWATLRSNPMDAPDISEKFKHYWRDAGPGGFMGGFRASFRLHWMRPSPTLQRVHTYGGAFHPGEPRALTTAERLRLAGFPDGFAFQSWRACVRRVGNSVPPPLMRAVAEALMPVVRL